MIRKWIVLNIGITMLVIVLVGFTIKELACYQFSQYADSALQSQQFRQTIEGYLFDAGLLTLIIAIFVHLFFAKKILTPLDRLSNISKGLIKRSDYSSVNAISNDEVGQIAGELDHISNRVDYLHQQRNQMIADLAHELRTPLTTLNGYLEGLEEGVFDQDESIYALLKKECTYLTDLVENMHELHQWENEEINIKKQWYQIKDVIYSGLASIQNKFDELGIQVEKNVDTSSIYCDQNAICSVLSHLFDNIARYDVGKKVLIEGKHLNDKYVISVSNRGLPIPQGAENHLCDRFFRVENSRNRETGGAGLGLTIVSEIVKALGGEIGFYTEDNFHTFYFLIPVSNSKE